MSEEVPKEDYPLSVDLNVDGNIISNESATSNVDDFNQMESVALVTVDMETSGVVDSSEITTENENIETLDDTTKIEIETKTKTDNSSVNNLSRYFETNLNITGENSEKQDFFSCLTEQKTQHSINAAIKPEEKPTLMKFFVEEKSGTDVTGKAFFDKIAGSPNPTPRQDGNLMQGLIPGDAKYSAEESFLCGITDSDMYEAWIPLEETKKILLKCATSPPGTFRPEKEHLTTPSIIIEEEMVDPLKSLLIEVNSPVANQRKTLSANDVAQNEEGLKELVAANCYHAAINLTSRLLQSTCIPDKLGRCVTPKSLQLWLTRITLYVKLGKFSYAEVESEAFGNFDRPDMYYQFFPDIYPNKKGSLVPFSFRHLLAELPHYQGNHQVALNNLYTLLNVIQKIIKNLENGFAADGSMVEIPEERKIASLNLWRSREIRVFYSVLNCALSQKDYIMAVSVAHILMDKDKQHFIQLHSALGRIYLQLGDLKQAESYFNLASVHCENSAEENLEIEKLINSALLAVAHSNNEEAYQLYEKALALQPENPMLVNNMAVCLLYMGRLKDSLSLLENTIQSNPKACLQEGILFNICTLYELESSHCTQKKQNMLNLISTYAGDNLNISCLKIPPTVKGYSS